MAMEKYIFECGRGFDFIYCLGRYEKFGIEVGCRKMELRKLPPSPIGLKNDPERFRLGDKGLSFFLPSGLYAN